MRAVVVAVVVVVSWITAACGSSDAFEDVLVDWTALKAKMCGCPDKTCTDAVMAEWTAYRTSLRTKVGRAQPTAEQERRGRELETGLRECRRKIDPAGSGSAEPSS
ncbi:MAG: hypothetical protein AB7O24_28135 [Kofleriaceae bacterium]